jgi:16S rRNA (adenine1518-N6/adenine1519-N6)-dimethyltransferase
VKREAGKKKRPKLGQNFLADERAAARIVDTLGDLTDTTVLEIGAGRGALTDILAARARRVIALELDRVLSAQLRMRYARRPNVEVVEGDVLAIDLNNLLRRRPSNLLAAPQDMGRAKVIGNLPYYITSDILLRLFAAHGCIAQLVIMVQREVAERIAARPRTRDYGLLSATSQLYARVEKQFTLPPGAFAPPPKVHSTVLRLTMEPRFTALDVDEAGFLDFLRLSFGQKRKTLFNNLKTRYDGAEIKRAIIAAGARADVRAEALSLEEAAAVYRALRAAVAA